jgi:murein L,D-transpeptidase YafK
MPNSNIKKFFLKTTLLVIILFGFSFFIKIQTGGFKSEQIKNKRVKLAYETKWEDLQKLMQEKKINPQNFSLYLRVFKLEKLFEIWVKNTDETKFQILKTIPICASSGDLGPKRKEGDLQVPEGFYEINAFNPNSSYNLAIKVSYPNASDRVKGAGNRLGGDIMVHGECCTIGCIPLQNDPIRDVYVLCVEARNRSSKINIDIFPCKFSKQNMDMLKENYSSDKFTFWESIKEGYLYFEEHKQLPKVSVTKKGDYAFEK